MHAKATQADLVILDDKVARNTARYMDLKITGTLGVIIKSKEKGYIQAVRPVMEKLIQNGLYISPEIQKIVLKAADEE